MELHLPLLLNLMPSPALMVDQRQWTLLPPLLLVNLRDQLDHRHHKLGQLTN